ncbi:DUF917 family protein [Bacillus thermophilus]|uniref:DUF917 family protein n=1 Tax=Siminovitchia thermophila TaxID=1245522 RepID=A0ABS2R5H0_9BACI|nr:DUF917 domain-containing protein [Siminovitchia thermophila]MBM7714833.1 DUF917 family protein [Siminovitchia thermophila]ONK21719.1 hypothetical protein BLX87_19695 [Bacillus sp. VT-16-64]
MSVYQVLERWGIKNYRVIDKKAIEEITLGASILATGGGGDPEIGLLWTLGTLARGKDVVLIHPEDIPDEVVGASVGCLGAPIVLTEKPPSQNVLEKAFKQLSSYLNKDLEVVIPFECGGVNSTVAYAIAGELGIPVVDVDGMNRAFPELHQTSWVANGSHASPAVSVDDRGNMTIIDTKEDNIRAETIARSAAMAYGGISWKASYPLTGKEIKEKSILYSQSIAWEIGKAVKKARESHRDPIEEVMKKLKETREVDSFRVFNGKIVDIDRDFGGEATKGFSSGRIRMEGIGKYKNQIAEIDFQNEWLRLKVDGETLCLPPDLIAILDNETGEPIRTDIMKYGYRGSILLIPAQERMRTKRGLEIFGPSYFGYEEEYVPVEKIVSKKGCQK